MRFVARGGRDGDELDVIAGQEAAHGALDGVGHLLRDGDQRELFAELLDRRLVDGARGEEGAIADAERGHGDQTRGERGHPGREEGVRERDIEGGGERRPQRERHREGQRDDPGAREDAREQRAAAPEVVADESRDGGERRPRQRREAAERERGPAEVERRQRERGPEQRVDGDHGEQQRAQGGAAIPRARAKRTRKVTAKKKSEAPKSTEQTSRSAAVPVPSRCATIIAAPRASPAPSSAPTIQGRRARIGASSGRRSARAKRLIGTSAKARWKSGTSARVVW